MAKRMPRTQICSGCHLDKLETDMYTVEKFTDPTNPKKYGSFYKLYCKKCIKDTSQFYRIHEMPKTK